MGSQEREELSGVETQEGRFAPWRWLRRLWQRTFAEPLRRVDEESRAYLASEAGRRPDWKTMTVMVTAAVSLTIQNFFGHLHEADRVAYVLDWIGLSQLGQHLLEYKQAGESLIQMHELTYWAAACIFVYVVIPSLVIRLVFRERLRDYGLKLQGALKDFWIYGVMFVIMVPLIFLCSANKHFQATYPFYRVSLGEALWPNFWRWEMMYIVQFWGLEFFFRGFMVHGTKHRFGLYSVFAMTVPYCMIHFAKPLPECCGSIVAGIVLGFMSLKTRSIWLGAAIHVTVALSMDFTSLWRQGFFS